MKKKISTIKHLSGVDVLCVYMSMKKKYDACLKLNLFICLEKWLIKQHNTYFVCYQTISLN